MDAMLTHLRDKEQLVHGPVLFNREIRAKHGATPAKPSAEEDWQRSFDA